jgi:ABC-type Fe3+-siderophore transport system permease subunit
MKTLRKMWAQVAGTVATLAYSLISDGDLTGYEVAVFAVQAVGIFLVWYSDNTPLAPYIKGVSAGYTAGAAVLVLALTDGLTSSEWGQIGLAALTAIVVLGLGDKKRAVAPGTPLAA